MEIEDSLVLDLIAIKLEPTWLPTVGPHSTAKASVTSQLGGGEEKEGKEQENKKGAPDNPRASRQKASPREAGRRGAEGRAV